MFGWLFGHSEKTIVKQYYYWGCEYGDALSYWFMGKCVGFDKLEKKFQYWSKQYMALGYEPISVDDFVSAGGYGNDMSHKLRQKKSE